MDATANHKSLPPPNLFKNVFGGCEFLESSNEFVTKIQCLVVGAKNDVRAMGNRWRPGFRSRRWLSWEHGLDRYHPRVGSLGKKLICDVWFANVAYGVAV
ncbi:hypothetical protein ASD85_06235 [Rhizobium sp. Root651]|nr:hypothetical protein ASD85_06235 [Rhizobium sp. Root651]